MCVVRMSEVFEATVSLWRNQRGPPMKSQEELQLVQATGLVVPAPAPASGFKTLLAWDANWEILLPGQLS